MFGVSTQPAKAGSGPFAHGCLKMSLAFIGVWMGGTLCPAPLSVAAPDHSNLPAAIDHLSGTDRAHVLPAIAIAALDRASLEGAALGPSGQPGQIGSRVEAIGSQTPLEYGAFYGAPDLSSAMSGIARHADFAGFDDSSEHRPAMWPAARLAALTAPELPTPPAAPAALPPALPSELLAVQEQPEVAALAVPALPRAWHPPVEPTGLRVFGSVPLRTSSKALTRIVGNALETPDATCKEEASGGRCGTAAPLPWRKLARELQSLSAHALLDRVNREVNTRIRYVTDQSLHGVLDHWSTAAATMTEGAGDCEDFAILKMWLLREAGVAAQDMFIVVVRSPNLRTEHAVLAVRMGGDTYILDNLSGAVANARDVGYMPIFSTNAHGLWLHGFAHRRDVAERATR